MTYFISYGDDKYTNSKNRIKAEAINSGFFDVVNVYGRQDISEEFLQKTRPYIDMPRGGGYWLWKSFFLKKTLEEMSEGDYCVYVDAGCSVNPYGIDRFDFYKDLLGRSGILSFQMGEGAVEEKFTTGAIFNHLNIAETSTIRKTGQIVGGILIIRKCEKSLKLINEYYDAAINHTHLFSDEHNSTGNSSNFIDNRHDQSILSVLRKVYNSTTIEDETYADNMEGWNDLISNKKIPFLATRIRN
jgi:hypothetical protein